jgi:hypothetical protein
MPPRNNLRRSKIIAIVVIIVVITLLYSAGSALNHRGKPKVLINVAPTDSTVTIDGKKTKAHTVYLKPGTHTFTATRQYFDTAQITKNFQNDTTINLLPAASSQQAKRYILDHQDVQKQRDYVGGLQEDETTQKAASASPLIHQLPLHDRYFSIDYGQSPTSKDNSSIAIIVRASSVDGRAMAIDWIKQKGFDPSDYEIVFSDAPHPLQEGN